MTALKEYERLESGGLWRMTPQDQRRDVIVSFGDATLVISDSANRALSHWSLAAVTRKNPGQRPAIFTPDVDATETLEIDDPDMIDAVERVRKTILKNRPRAGRLRFWGIGLNVAAVGWVALFWAPDALTTHTLSVVPDVKRSALGRSLQDRVERVAGTPCRARGGRPALNRLRARLLPDAPDAQLIVAPALPLDILYLPGDIVVMNRSLFEDYESADVVAGYILAAKTHAESRDPLRDLLETAGLRSTFRLLTTGEMKDQTLRDYGEVLVSTPTPRPADQPLLAAFETAEVASTPFAFAIDVSGETSLGLIEADPHADTPPRAVLGDVDWVILQQICGG